MRDKPIDALNMVPFIDIMLVLLVIVLTTSTFIARGQIPVRLPRATAAPEAPAPVVLEIAADGTVYHAGRAVAAGALRAHLAALPADSAVLLRADRSLPLQRFIDVADVLRQLGLQRVAVQTESARP